MHELRILLATDRPAIHAFFLSLRQATTRPLAIDRIPLAVQAPADCPVSAATVAAVDVAPNPATALRLCRRLQTLRPGLPILGLLCCPHAATPWQVQALLAAGVGGLLDLHAPAVEALRILHRVARGEFILRARLAGGDDGKGTADRAALAAHLRDETSVRLLNLLTHGLTDSAIGQRLCLSPDTVKHRIERLRADVGAPNRIALAAWAGRHGFDRPPPD